MTVGLRKEMESLTGAYYEEAPEDAAYPYAVFSLRRLGDGEGKQTCSLEVNIWDQHPYYSRAEDMMDALEERLHRCSLNTGEGFLVRIFKGARQNVPDPDRTIRRVREIFEAQIYKGEDWG